MTNIKNAIEITNITKHFKSGSSYNKKALKGFDLNIPRGCIFGLLGPNGAGKSTLINILYGLTIKTSGTVKIWGIDIDDDHRNAKNAIGIVPQEFVIDPFFDPMELLELHAGLYGIKKQNRKTEEILKSVGLWEQRHAYPRQMSGGMKRRLLIAKAMVHQPPILVLDEPTAGVDIELRKQLWDNIRQLNKMGTTVILTTHYLEEAQELCDYIAVINKGNLIKTGNVKELLKNADKKTITVNLDKTFDKKHIPNYIDLISVENNIIELSFKPTKTNIGNVLTELNNSNYNIQDISTQETKLEDLFLQLTMDKK
ncbi:ABC transporter ATP-binding protein [Alphaproteobacteria bacterium]|nr:ABC transporter ATP-binding protein [Alphaproteobacteria bacterium]